MGHGFLDHMRVVPDHRISGMVTYPAGAGAARGRGKSNEITAIPELLDML